MMSICLVKSADIDESEYVSYTMLNGKGMHGENLGPTRIIGAEYKLITYFSLREYNTKYNLLGEKMKNITQICKERKHAELCEKYQIVITNLYNEINDQKERMYLSLGSESIKDKDVQRKRRGLINMIGNVMHTLFGVCDDKCTKKTQEAIMTTEESGRNILHILKQETTVVKSTVKRIGNTLNQTDELYKSISSKEKKLYEKITQVQNATEGIYDLLLAEEVYNLYTILINQFSFETGILEQIISAARDGIMHPSLMTPHDIAKTLISIEPTLKKQYSIPMGKNPSELVELQKITKISTYYSNETLVFVTTIPLIIDIHLTLYNILSIPVFLNRDNIGGWYVSPLTYNNIAITKDRKRFTTYTDKQLLSECKVTEIFRLCRTPQPIQDNSERQPCEVQLFKGTAILDNTEICTFEKFNLKRNIYHKLINTNKWIHAGLGTLTISCTNLTEPFLIEPAETGQIEIKNNNCQVFAKDAVLTGTDKTFINKEYKDFIPEVDMRKFLGKIPYHIHKFELKNQWEDNPDVQFTNLQDVSSSLDNVQQMIDDEITREQSQKHQFIHSNLLYVTIVLAVVSIILILAIYIILRCRYVSNTNIMEMPGRIIRYNTPNRNDYIRSYADTTFAPPPSPR